MVMVFGIVRSLRFELCGARILGAIFGKRRSDNREGDLLK